jgi:ElaB/YqjD/DUF883 family membrane-anchored ribosome-binding protein
MGETKDQVTAETWTDDTPKLVAYEVSAGTTGDADVDQLVEEIAYTRGEMTGTVEEIGDRLDPRHIVADARKTVRGATIGKVEEMATTAGDMVSNVGQTAQDTGSGIVETIRRNPLPAAMIGLGVTWLAMSSRSSGARSSDWTSGGRWKTGGSSWDTTDREMQAGYGSRSRPGDGVTDRVGDAVGQVQGKAGEVAGQVQGKAGEVAGQVHQTAAQLPNVARQVQDSAGRVVQENPLAVGAIALAVGAAVGMALPTTRPEHEIMGQARDSLIGRAESAASEAMNQASAAGQP